MEKMSTLCYLERDNSYLMLHRIKKKKDINKNKWIGVGGHFEPGESPDDCLLREVREETGYTLTNYRFRGIVTFLYGQGTEQAVTEYMHLFTAEGFIGEEISCDEGELRWIPKAEVPNLELWEGDRIFLRLLDESEEFFSLKLVYDTEDNLIQAVKNGKELPL